MNTYTGKEVKKNGVWYPITVKALTIQEANKKVNKETTKDPLRGRFYKVITL